MRSKNRIGLTLAAASLAALAAAPGAQATPFDATHNTVCENAAKVIAGTGASFQRTLHLNWGAKIIAPTPAAPLAKGFGYDVGPCAAFKLASAGGTKQISYGATGSGAGRASVGATDAPGAARNLNIDFGGTDEAPSQLQVDNANEGPNVVAGPDNDDGNLHTIPIAQGSVAVAIRVPDGCQIGPSARQISRLKLEGAMENVYDGPDAGTEPDYDEWGEIIAIVATPGGGQTNATCQDKRFKRVVRLDNGGTTFVFKRYLQEASDLGGTGQIWSQPSLANQAWPNDAGTTAVVRGAASGNGPVMDALALQTVDGGIGYADLGTARAKGFGWSYTGTTPDVTDRTVWVRVQGITFAGYVSPARTDNQAAGTAGIGPKGARCGAVTYANVPASTRDSWFDVDGIETPADYPICTLTYALTFDSLAAAKIPNSQARGRGRKDYIGYGIGAIGSGKGPVAAASNDYGVLPTSIKPLATAGYNDLEA